MKRLSRWIAVAAIFSITTVAAADEISAVKGPVRKGTIVEMSHVEVIMQAGRKKVSVPVNEITSINYDPEPVELKRARSFVQARQYDLALKELAAVKLAGIGRDLILQDIAYLKAHSTARIALAGRGNKKAAIKMMSGFISQHKANYRYFAAVEILGELAVSIGEYEMAAKLSLDLAQAPWPAHKLRAAVLEGRSLQAQKKYKEALEKYEKVLEESKNIAGAGEPKRVAYFGKRACLAALNINEVMDSIAELHGYSQFYSDGSSCCMEFVLWQQQGGDGDLAYFEAQVTTPGVTITHQYAEDLPPGTYTVISPTLIRYGLPLPNGLMTIWQTVSIRFQNVPATGATIKFTAYGSNGLTDPAFQNISFNIGANGECACLGDLWMKDTMLPDWPEDNGSEPTQSQLLYISRDIWVRTAADTTTGSSSNPGPDTTMSADQYYANEHQHQNPVYVNASTPGYVYVKVRNRGCAATYGGEMLRVYWAKASTGLPWPLPGQGLGVWNELDWNPTTVGVVEPGSLPPIAPGKDYVAQVPWVPPDPVAEGTDHFCLVARIETPSPSSTGAPFGMTVPEGTALWQNVANNNNIVWKNVTVVTPSDTRGKVIIRNTLDHEATLGLHFAVPERELRNNFLLHGDILIDLGEAVMNKWRRSGQRPRGFDVVGETTIKITDPKNATLDGLVFGAGEQHSVEVRMQLKRGAKVAPGTQFNWDMTQLSPLTKNARPSAIGGERYTFVVPKTAVRDGVSVR